MGLLLLWQGVFVVVVNSGKQGFLSQNGRLRLHVAGQKIHGDGGEQLVEPSHDLVEIGHLTISR